MVALLDPGFYGTGRVAFTGERDEQGHRTYTVLHRIIAGIHDGPATIMQCPGLPMVGSVWNFGNDIDIWAYCTPMLRVTADQKRGAEATHYWIAEQEFTTKSSATRCQDQQIEDPLLEPDRISGQSARTSVEARFDRHGDPIVSSSWEPIRGAQVEFDSPRSSIRIEQNRSFLGWNGITSMLTMLNDSPLWGYAARRVMFAACSFERRFYGTCNRYFVRTFDFDLSREGFDRTLPDEGTKVLNGHWEFDAWVLDDIPVGVAPIPGNPQHFMQYKDRNGENARVALDLAGKPWNGVSPAVPQFSLQYYPQGNLLLLDIPTSLET